MFPFKCSRFENNESSIWKTFLAFANAIKVWVRKKEKSVILQRRCICSDKYIFKFLSLPPPNNNNNVCIDTIIICLRHRIYLWICEKDFYHSRIIITIIFRRQCHAIENNKNNAETKDGFMTNTILLWNYISTLEWLVHVRRHCRWCTYEPKIVYFSSRNFIRCRRVFRRSVLSIRRDREKKPTKFVSFYFVSACVYYLLYVPQTSI